MQGTVLNIDLGALTGENISWQLYTTHSVINLGIWILIFAVCKMAYIFFKKQYSNIILFICFMLFAMQICGGIATLTNYYAQRKAANGEKTTDLVLTGENEYILSDDENVIVFVLDNFANYTLDNQVLLNYSNALDGYSDFTRFDNCNTRYVGTFPGDIHLLTGYEYDFEEKVETNFENVWQEDSTKGMYESLDEAGYDINIYMDSPEYICGLKMERIEGVFTNIISIDDGETAIPRDLINKFIRLSFYRYVPHALKASFWTSTGEIAARVTEMRATVPVEASYDFCESVLSGNMLQKQPVPKQVKFYMLPGVHGEYLIDHNGTYVPAGTDRIEQGCGYLTVIVEYMEQLKKLDLYDSSTIVIATDHGSKAYPQGIFLVKRKGETHETMQVSHVPILQKDMMMTIFDSIGLDYSQFGVSAFDREEDDEMLRYVNFWMKDDSLPDVEGGYNASYSYSYTGDGVKLAKELAEGKQPTEIIPLIDSFY